MPTHPERLQDCAGQARWHRILLHKLRYSGGRKHGQSPLLSAWSVRERDSWSESAGLFCVYLNPESETGMADYAAAKPIF